MAIGRSTHQENLDLCLTSRALGASEITFTGKKDSRLLRYVNGLNSKWGGTFRVQFAKNYREALKSSAKYAKVYLTRYGIPLQEKRYSIRTYKNIVLIVTLNDEINAVQELSDFNISVSSQPHCSAAAIAIFLHEFFNGRELAIHFENAKFKVVPKERGTEIKITR